MTAPATNCPSCGAEVRFRWAGAVQTVCPHCASVLVRTDVDLRRVGQVSEPPPVTSRIQLGTRGTYRGRPFEVVGRIAYQYERGFWSEWHLAFADGASGWLSDAQDDYTVTFAPAQPAELPPASAVRPGARFHFHGVPYTVATVTRARYAGVEGDLPFEYWDKDEVLFADLRGDTEVFATLDYSEEPALLFQGEPVDFPALELRNLREEDAARRVEGARTLACPSCGGAVELRMPGETVNAVCRYCQSVLDVGSEKLAVVQSFRDRVKVEPLIPLGSTGRMHGAEWTVLGFQQQSIRVEGVTYSWREYLLHSPERGFRYLTEYAGHWNDVAPLKSVPQTQGAGKGATARVLGETFRHFQHANAECTFVLGEFPWQVRVGDTAFVDDFVHPPRMLSREQTADETTWSLGEYVSGERVWQAFGVKGSPPRPRGTYANQPSPHPSSAPLWSGFLALAALVVVVLIARSAFGSREVLSANGGYTLDGGEQNVFVSEPFTLSGRPSSVDVRIHTTLDNAWAEFELSLVDEETGRTREASREVSYYHGVEDGERWTEGDQGASVRLPAVPAGRYRLVAAPQASSEMGYTLRVRRDTPGFSLYLLALIALLVPPAWRSMQHAVFERERWMESDYPPESGDDDE